MSLQTEFRPERNSLGGDEEEPRTQTSEPRTPTREETSEMNRNFESITTTTTTTTTGSNDPSKNASLKSGSLTSATKPKSGDISTNKCGSPKMAKHLSKLSSQSNVLSSKIGESLSGYMEKISQKMKHENMSVLSTEFPERTKSHAQKEAEISIKMDLKRNEENKNENENDGIQNIYEFIDMPKLQPGNYLCPLHSFL